MFDDILEPAEAWEAAEQEIDFSIEEKHEKEWRRWRQLRGS